VAHSFPFDKQSLEVPLALHPFGVRKPMAASS